MSFHLDTVTLGVSDVSSARTFYTAAFAPPAFDGDRESVRFDLHGTGTLALSDAAALAADADDGSTGFRGYVLSSIVDQPGEVELLLDAAAQAGASVVKPAKKSFFGGFHAVYRAPDGTLWKLSAAAKKNTDAVRQPPQPNETAAFLGVSEPKLSKAFYEALGMTVDRDYGNKFVDFTVDAGTWRLGALPRKDLAKYVGVTDEGTGSRVAIFNRMAASREEVDTLLTAAERAGGAIQRGAEQLESTYAGYFSDPDGYLWKVACA